MFSEGRSFEIHVRPRPDSHVAMEKYRRLKYWPVKEFIREENDSSQLHPKVASQIHGYHADVGVGGVRKYLLCFLDSPGNESAVRVKGRDPSS